jgi:DNA polymerase III subunit delta
MDAVTFLERGAKAPPQPIYVVTGDEAFLKRQVLAALQKLLLGDADPSFAWASLSGADEVPWSTVRSELDTLPFLSPRRVVVIESADDFVSDNRATLEKYVGQPSKCGVLVLEVKTWPSNTKLAKLVPEGATIVCKTPQANLLVKWCTNRASAAHAKRLAAEAAEWLVELVGPDLGLLDQELAKLAVYVGKAQEIGRADVDRLVGRSREADTFKIFDAIGDGRTADALAILNRLIEEGEDPLKILGAFSWQLRRLAQVGRAAAAGRPVASAMDATGVIPWQRAGVQKQLHHLGRRRLAQLFDWLLEADLTMKSTGGLPGRLVLERLIVRLARPRAG